MCWQGRRLCPERLFLDSTPVTHTLRPAPATVLPDPDNESDEPEYHQLGRHAVEELHHMAVASH